MYYPENVISIFTQSYIHIPKSWVHPDVSYKYCHFLHVPRCEKHWEALSLKSLIVIKKFKTMVA